MHECRVYDKNGKLKKVHSPEQLLKKHWDDYKNFSGPGSKKARGNAKIEVAKAEAAKKIHLKEIGIE